jgi:hypothetical protein
MIGAPFMVLLKDHVYYGRRIGVQLMQNDTLKGWFLYSMAIFTSLSGKVSGFSFCMMVHLATLVK